jgi:hypothetical protein
VTGITITVKDMPGPTVLERAAVIGKKLAELKPHALAGDDGSLAAWAVIEGLKDLENELALLVTAATPAPEPDPEPEEAPEQVDWVNDLAKEGS